MKFPFKIVPVLLTTAFWISCHNGNSSSRLAEDTSGISNPVSKLADILNPTYRLRNPKWHQQDLNDRLRQSEIEIDKLIRAEYSLRASVAHAIRNGGLGESMQNSVASASGELNLQIRILGLNTGLSNILSADEQKDPQVALNLRRAEFTPMLGAWLGVTSPDQKTYDTLSSINLPALAKLLHIKAMAQKTSSDLDQIISLLNNRAREKCSKAVDLPAACPVLPSNKTVYEEYRKRYQEASLLRERMGSTPDKLVAGLAVKLFKSPYDRESIVLSLKFLADQIRTAPLWKDILDVQKDYLEKQAFDLEKYSIRKNLAQFLARSAVDTEVPILLDVSLQNADRELDLATGLIENRNRKISDTVANVMACTEFEYLKSDLEFLKSQQASLQNLEDRQKQIAEKTLTVANSKAGQAANRVEAEKVKIDLEANDRTRMFEDLRKQMADIENQFNVRDSELKRFEEELRNEKEQNRLKLADFEKMLQTYTDKAEGYPEARTRLASIRDNLVKEEQEAKQREAWATGPMSDLVAKAKALSPTSVESEFQNLWKLAFDQDKFCYNALKDGNTPSSVLEFCDALDQAIILGRMNNQIKQDSDVNSVRKVCDSHQTSGNKGYQIAACNILQDLERDSSLLEHATSAINGDFATEATTALNTSCNGTPQSVTASLVCSSLEKIKFYDAVKAYEANPQSMNCQETQKDGLSAEFCNLQDLLKRTNYWKQKLLSAVDSDGALKKDIQICPPQNNELAPIPQIEELCRFQKETTQGVTLGEDFPALQTLPDIVKEVGPFDNPSSWDSQYIEPNVERIRQVMEHKFATDIVSECSGWFQRVKDSRFSQGKNESSFYKSAYEALLANAEIKCQAALYWLASNTNAPNGMAYALLRESGSPGVVTLQTESLEARSLRAEIITRGNPGGSAAAILEVKKSIKDRLRGVTKGLNDILDLTQNGGFSTKTQLVERIRSIETEIERQRFELERTIDTTVSKAEELRTAAGNELKATVRDAEDRIKYRAPQEVAILKAEVEDGLFAQQNKVRFIQAQYRQTEADRLNGISREMDRFLLDNEIARIRLESDSTSVKAASASLKKQVRLLKRERSLLKEWYGNQDAYFKKQEELIEKGNALQIRLSQLGLQTAQSEKDQADSEVQQARLEIEVRAIQANIQTSESSRQIRNSEIRIEAYKKACEMKLDTGLSDQDLQLVTAQILTKTEIQIDLSLRNLQVLAQLTNNRIGDVLALRQDFTAFQTQKLIESPMAQSQRLRVIATELHNLRGQLLPRIYSTLAIRRDKLEIPLYPALTQNEADATALITNNETNKPLNRLAQYYSAQFKGVQADFSNISAVPPVIDDAFDEASDDAIAAAIDLSTEQSRLTPAGLEQCLLDTFKTKAEDIENVAGATARRTDLSAPVRLPGNDDIRQLSNFWMRWYGSRARALQNNSEQSRKLQDIKRLWVASKYVHLMKVASAFSKDLNAAVDDDIVAGNKTIKLGIDSSSLAEFSFIQGLRLKPVVVVDSDTSLEELPYELSCEAGSLMGVLSGTTLTQGCTALGSLTSGHPVTSLRTGMADFATWRPQDLWPERNIQPDQSAAVLGAGELLGSSPILHDFHFDMKKMAKKSLSDAQIRGLGLRIELVSFPTADRSSALFDWKKDLIPSSPEGDLSLSNIYMPWEAQVFDNNQGVLGWLLGDGVASREIPESCDALR